MTDETELPKVGDKLWHVAGWRVSLWWRNLRSRWENR